MSVKTAGYATTHKPLGKGKRNGPWGTGQLPAYVQNVADGIRDSGKPLGQAIQIAIGRVRDWARGEGNVSAEVRAAAQKAVAELDALLAKTKGKRIVEADALDAAQRLDLLDRLGLPIDGPGALADADLVIDAVLLEAADFESMHPRGGGGQWVAKGSSGRDVRAVQRRVGARVDGDFGAKTKAAVERFQTKHGLVVDGVVGRQTLAALRGRKDAKRVKVGALTADDRKWLAGHVRSDGGRRRIVEAETPSRLVEAVAPAGLLDRVKALEPGEHARLPDGGAVRHKFTGDGRKVWAAGSPTRYGDTDSLSWGEERDTPEDAVAQALTDSARRSHPDSIGGAASWGRYIAVLVDGQAAEFYGVTAAGQPLVRFQGRRGDPATVSWSSLTPNPRLVEADSPRSHGGEPTHHHKARSHRNDAKKTPGTPDAPDLIFDVELRTGDRYNPAKSKPTRKIQVRAKTEPGARQIVERDHLKAGEHIPASGIRMIPKEYHESRRSAGNLNPVNDAPAASSPSKPDKPGTDAERGRALRALDPLKVGDTTKWGNLEVKRLADKDGKASFAVEGKQLHASDTIDRMLTKGRATAAPARSNAPENTATDADGNAIRMRQPAGGSGWIVEVQHGKEWKNQAGTFASEAEARKHFDERKKGGYAGAIHDMTRRQGATPRKDSAPVDRTDPKNAAAKPAAKPAPKPREGDTPEITDRLAKAREIAVAKNPGANPYSSDIATAFMNAEQHATLDALQARSNTREAKPSEAMANGDVRFWITQMYSNGKNRPAQKLTVKPDGTVVDNYGKEVLGAPDAAAVKKAQKKVAIKPSKPARKAAAKPVGESVTRTKGAAGQVERAQLRSRIARLDVGAEMQVNDHKVERVGMGQWRVDGRSYLSEADALTAAMRPRRRS